jgi:Tol biopolymer transport system component
VVVAGVAGLAGWFLRPAPADEHLKVFEIDLGPGASISSRGLIVSPDGRTIAFAGVQSTTQPLRMLYVRRLDQTGFTALAGTEDAIYPFFSPGGDWIGFVTRGPSASGEGSVDALKKVSLAGGDPFTLCSCYGVGTWADDGNIYYAEGRTIWRVPAAGGDPQPLLTPPDDEPDTWYFRPTALPGGRALLFELFRGAPGSTVTGERNIATVDLDELQIHEVVVDGSDPRYSRTGHIVYGRNNALFAVPFDAAELTVTGEPTPVRQEVRLNNTGMVPAGISADGTLVYQPGVLAAGADARYALVWVDRSGRKERVSERRGNFGAVRLSPDGRRVALEDGTSSQRGIWILGIDDGSFAPLNNEGLSLAPLWSPDGSKVYFNWEAEVTGQSVGARGGIYARDADFGAPREQILETEGGVFPHSWSADGEDLVLHEMIEGESRRRILVMPVAGEDRTAFSPYDASGQFNQRSPVVSPDGRWVAYVSEQSGRDEVYVRPFPDSGPRVQISDNGGVEPMWGADSSELFYREIDLSLRTTMIAAALDIQETPRVAGRTELFSGFYWFMATNRARTTFDYDRANDRFLMVDAAPDEGDEESPNARINVLVDWFPELERQVPGGR